MTRPYFACDIITDDGKYISSPLDRVKVMADIYLRRSDVNCVIKSQLHAKIYDQDPSLLFAADSTISVALKSSCRGEKSYSVQLTEVIRRRSITCLNNIGNALFGRMISRGGDTYDDFMNKYGLKEMDYKDGMCVYLEEIRDPEIMLCDDAGVVYVSMK